MSNRDIIAGMRRNITIIIFAVLLISAVVYVIKESEKISLLETFLPEKVAVFKNVHMSGVEGSCEAWEVFAKEGWTGRDKFATTLDYVTNAGIKRNDRQVIKSLRARRMRIANNKDIEIFREVNDEKSGKQYLRLLIDFGAVSSPPKKEKKFSSLTADYIKFNPDTKKGIVRGNIDITKDKLTIRSELVLLDLDRNTATFEGRSSFIKKDSKLFADSATAFFDEDTINMSGSVEVIQTNKKAFSDNAGYDDNSRAIVMTPNVHALIEKPKSFIREESAKKYKDEETQKALTIKTNIDCDKLTINTDNNDCSASGNVLVSQKDKEARSDRAVYTQNNETILMTGNVFMKKKDDWVKADKVIVSVDTEIFEAIGGVETTFKVKKGSK